jgi:hypothetical protein
MLHSSEIGSRFYHMQKTVIDDIMTVAQLPIWIRTYSLSLCDGE